MDCSRHSSDKYFKISTILVILLSGLLNESKAEIQNIARSDEKQLLIDIFRRYNEVGKMGRPVKDSSRPVLVKFGLGLIQLDLDEKRRILTLSMWTRYEWRDEYLTWNISEYGNVSTIHVDHDQIWKPDIMLYNTAEVSRTFRDSQAVVNAEGIVQWYPHTIFSSSCSVDVTNFPFDEQECHMWFGSWTHNSKEIDLHMGFPHGIDLSTFQSDYKESCSWEILNVTAERTNEPGEDVQPNFVILKFHLSMKRKHVLSTYILTLPCIFLACLTVVVFWLPPERPDRTGLAMSIFGSLMFLLLILVGAAPPSGSSIPTLGIYYSFNMTIIMFAIILSSLVVNISKSNGRPVPRWLQCILSCGSSGLRKTKDAKLYMGEEGPSVSSGESLSQNTRKDWLNNVVQSGYNDHGSHPVHSGNSCSRRNPDRSSSLSRGCHQKRSLKEASDVGNSDLIVWSTQEALPACGNAGCAMELLKLNNGEESENDHRQIDNFFKPQTNHVGKDHGCSELIKTDSVKCLRRKESSIAMVKSINSVKESLDRIEKKVEVWQKEASSTKQSSNNDWQKLSETLDKIFFVLYIVIIITSLLVLFPRPQHHPEPEAQQ